MKFYTLSEKKPKRGQRVLIHYQKHYPSSVDDGYYVCVYDWVDSEKLAFIEAEGRQYARWYVEDVISWVPIEDLKEIDIVAPNKHTEVTMEQIKNFECNAEAQKKFDENTKQELNKLADYLRSLSPTSSSNVLAEEVEKTLTEEEFIPFKFTTIADSVWEGKFAVNENVSINVPLPSPTEFADKMKEIADTVFDQEDRHRAMDDLMLDILRKVGYNDGVDVFENTEKWYS